MDFKHTRTAVLSAALFLLFVGSFMLVREGRIWVSPDENANEYFAETFATTGSLSTFDAYNLTFDDRLYPRSVVSVDGRLVPAGFLGLPLYYGAIAAVFGRWVIPVLTPIVALLAALAWKGIVRRLFDREIAWLSAILLAIHPAWWYYSARTLMPNVLFVSLIIFCVWFLFARPLRTWMARGVSLRLPGWVADVDVVVGGLCFGAALMTRPSECWWVIGGALSIWIAYRKSIPWAQALLFALSMLLALSPLPLLNQDLYGSALTFGYQIRQDATVSFVSVTTAGQAQTAPDWWLDFERLVSPLFPFGIHPRNILRNVAAYGISMFWWLSVLMVIGLRKAFSGNDQPKDVRMKQKFYGGLTAVTAAYLIVLYGSWVFHDNPDPNVVSIANSYVRYWLPLFVLSTPYLAFAVRWFAQKALTPFSQLLICCTLILACLGLSVHAVFFTPGDGLAYAAQGLQAANELRGVLLDKTEPDAVVIVDRADKLFWPERHVRYPLRDEGTYQLMPEIVLLHPLYYYGITFPKTDLDYLNQTKLKDLGLQIIDVETFGEETLYRIYSSD
jgi:hypothetical protein